MGKEITYVGHYDILRGGRQERVYSLAGARKMDFVCDELVALGYHVNIVSAAHSDLQGNKNISESFEKIREGVNLTLTPSNEATWKMSRIRRVLLAKWWLFKYLIKHCDRDHCVMVYHNYADAIPIVFAQKIKGFKLILEIEEQYSMVWNISRFQTWKENLLLKYAKDGALVVSEILAKRLNIKNPVVSYGNYSVYEGNVPPKWDINRTDLKGKKREKEKITLIFTGGIETVRNGAFLSIECMKYLPEEYRLFLSGPVQKGVEEKFRTAIAEINSICGREACVYKGMLDDTEYEDLLLNADIALNPQRDGRFGEFVFPSKILTYMSYGLPVVSTKGKSIVESKLAKYIVFAEDFTAESVAVSIIKLTKTPFVDYRYVLKQLQDEFRDNLKKCIEQIQ